MSYVDKYPFLKNLMLADNDFHYFDEKGNRIQVDSEELIRKLRECKNVVSNEKTNDVRANQNIRLRNS